MTKKYLVVSWKEYGQLAFNLFKKINSSQNNHFDRLVALSSGGLTLSQTMKDYLNIKKLSTMQISFYQGIEERKKSPVIIQSVPAEIENESILVFDDVNDTGETLLTAKNYLFLRGANKITTATIFQKPHTKNPSDYFADQTNAWIIFPDERREMIRLITKNLNKKKIKGEGVKEYLNKIGFIKEEIAMFVDIDNHEEK